MHDKFSTWPQIVAAMKKEFLPRNHDYMLLCDIANRTQRHEESLGDYLINMQALFKCLATPITEEQQLFLIQKNLHPQYAMNIVPFDVQSLNHLTEICKRIDDVFQVHGRYFESTQINDDPLMKNQFKFFNICPENVNTETMENIGQQNEYVNNIIRVKRKSENVSSDIG